VALHIVKTRKHFTIVEDLIKPCVVDVCAELRGEPCAKVIKDIPFSNYTINQRVLILSDDVTEQLINKFISSHWLAIQMDESIGVSYHAISLIIVERISRKRCFTAWN
jgi:hypothetical protein